MKLKFCAAMSSFNPVRATRSQASLSCGCCVDGTRVHGHCRGLAFRMPRAVVWSKYVHVLSALDRELHVKGVSKSWML